MSFQTGSIDKNGLARTEDGKLYVTSVGTASITGGTIALDAGLVGSPSLTWGDATTGFYRTGANQIAMAFSGNSGVQISAGIFRVASNYTYAWSDTVNNATGSSDTTLGRQAAGRVVVNGATATPAGGATSGPALCFGSTSGFGIYIGSGVPTLSAAQGSLYLRSDGSSTSTRAYINSSAGSGTTWTAITTAA
jgi:hypothetical protein